jgi:hypothetical protein
LILIFFSGKQPELHSIAESVDWYLDMLRLLLSLLALPGLVSTLLLLSEPVRAESESSDTAPPVLDLSLRRGVIFSAPESTDLSIQHPMLEFTIEESDTAIALFGCDCPFHLNRVRRMRGQPLLQ